MTDSATMTLPGAATGAGASPSKPEQLPTSPGAVPQQPEGSHAGAVAQLGVALRMIERAYPDLIDGSDEKKIALEALGKLTKVVGKQEKGRLTEAEMQLMTSALKQKTPTGAAQGGGTPPVGTPTGGGQP